ncbi:OmpA family protein [Flocculibacter collagenilyticus]|uniref:OmpA family protein n=1 Tax=Flocculibacter collagenilyticus TaxID=2744479 RepID=UPI0018F35A73|nr:OmpA family protein [Flocculibacter collagenilyticus]
MNHLPKALILAASIAVTGCASNASNTQKGAGIGAVVGAVLGKATGDHDKSRYAWGAVVGAIAGGAIGNYMDKQEEEFNRDLADSGVKVVRDGDVLTLQMPGNITFKSNSTQISGNFYPILNDVALVLNRYEKTYLVVEGNTDSVGAAEYNMTLSQKRADSIASYLQTQNIHPKRLATEANGEHQPIASNQTAEGRSQNRRVELKIIPVTG